MKITKGKIERAQKVVIYGPEGIGKSTIASKFPDPLFIDTEGSTAHLDVSRTEEPSSYTMLMEQLEYIKAHQVCKTIIIDTADWAEKLVKNHILSTSSKKSIEDFGYGKGYTILAEYWGAFLNKLNELIDVGIHVVLTAHAQMRKFEQPEELGAYDRWELKLEKKTAALTKEWADMILFANYEVLVTNVDNQGAAKGKNKATGGRRVMHTTHNPSWDAKNRQGLPDKLAFDYGEIAHIFATKTQAEPVPQEQGIAPKPPIERAPTQVPDVAPPPQEEIPLPEEPPIKQEGTVITDIADTPPQEERLPSGYKPALDGDVGHEFTEEYQEIPKALMDLMAANNVSVSEIQNVVAQKGYFPKDTPIKNYPLDFVNGVLVGAWTQVHQAILDNRGAF